VCPRCGGHLLPFAIPQGEALGCDACRGVWVDERAFAALRQGMEDEVVGVAGALMTKSRDFSTNTRPAICCPICRRVLTPTEVSRVRIEFCAAHGTWIDCAEVEAIGAAVADASSGSPSSRDWAERISGDIGVLPEGLVTALGTIIAVGDHSRRAPRPRRR
jgi:Zn-finger nucleic acid-binding protein